MNTFPSSIKNYIFSKLSNLSSYGIIIFNEELSIVFWSKGANRITGYTEKETLGKKFEDVTILEIFSKKGEEIDFKNILNNLLINKKNVSKILYIRHKKNYRFPIKIKFYFFQEKKKKEKFIIGIFGIFDALDYSRRIISSIKKIANKDHLTSLPNRRFVEYLINKKINEFKRFGTKFGIILFDINNFKSINDCLGHNSGDNILIEFSKIITKNLRSCDILSRWGGDEFIALIINADEEKIKNIKNKLCEIIKKKIFKEKGYDLNLTVSAGISEVQKMDNLTKLIERADNNMYNEKFKNLNP